MLFVTETFLLFFIVVFLVFWALPPGRFRFGFLVAASLFFYATWNVWFTFHLLLVVGINYTVMEYWRKRRSKWIFVLLQTANVANIAFFKYFYLLADMLGLITGQEWLRQPHLLDANRAAGHEILLPLAISFYTFQIMAYGFDIVRGVYDRRHTFLEVLLFKTFFPQLIAGPIMRPDELLPQIEKCRNGSRWDPDPDRMKRGLWLILGALVKKILVADQLLAYAFPLFHSGHMPGEFEPLSLWKGVLASMFMLYADFSAYSDFARGFGFLLGFKIPINFKAPFFMKSFSNFWERWHLTFSLWIRDYIYIPLGGSRVGELRNYLNLTFTFFLGGLWHGASYTFVLWGIFMGIILSVESFMGRRRVPEWPASLWGKALRLGATWILFVPVSLFFFAPGLEWTLRAFVQMFHLTLLNDGALRALTGDEVLIGSFVAVIFFHFVEEKPGLLKPLRKYESWLLPVTALAVVLALTQFAGGQKDFFYFQF